MLVTAGLVGTGADLQDPGGASDIMRDFGLAEPRAGLYAIRLNLGGGGGSTETDDTSAGPLGHR